MTAVAACTATFFCGLHGAYANGRYPKADQLLIAPDDDAFLAVRTTFGFLVSRDSGRNWDWICERAIGYSGVQDPTIGLMPGGVLIASLSEGIARSTDQGCHWGFSEADLGNSPVIDLTVRKDAQNQALALVWDSKSVSYGSRILASDDQGRSFVPYGNPIDESVLITTIDVASSNPHRVYASGTRSVDGVRSGSLFRSDDDGQHWTEYSVPFDAKLEQGVYIAAVDPEHENTLYLRTSSASVGRLLVSHDGGQQLSVVYTGSLLSFALSPDGKQLYFGGEGGLYGGLASDLKFEKRATLRLLCLAASADTVYACSDEHSGFTLGASSDGGVTFEPLLHLKTVRGPLPCSAAECQSDWPLVRAQLGIPVPNADDPGNPGDAGNTSVPPASAATHSSCAVASPQSGNPSELGLLIAFAIGALSRRRKSRVRTRPPAK